MNVMQFLKEVRFELSRVEWPKPDEFIGATIVTLLLVISLPFILVLLIRLINGLFMIKFLVMLKDKMAYKYMKKWYVVQILAGYENIIKADLLKRIEEKGLQEIFGEILIPSAKTKQFFEASDDIKDQQLFPGYMLVEMEAVPETIRLVSTTPRVSRFLGGRIR